MFLPKMRIVYADLGSNPKAPEPSISSGGHGAVRTAQLSSSGSQNADGSEV